MKNFNPNNHFANVEKDQKESKTIFRKYRNPAEEEFKEMEKIENEKQIKEILDTHIFISDDNKSCLLSELINSDDPKKRLQGKCIFKQMFEFL